MYIELLVARLCLHRVACCYAYVYRVDVASLCLYRVDGCYEYVYIVSLCYKYVNIELLVAVSMSL